MNAEQWRKGTLSVTLESTAKPVKVAAVGKPSEPESVLQKQLTDARANVKKLTLQVQELTEANTALSKKLVDAAGKEKVVQITTLATATPTTVRALTAFAFIGSSAGEDMFFDIFGAGASIDVQPSIFDDVPQSGF